MKVSGGVNAFFLLGCRRATYPMLVSGSTIYRELNPPFPTLEIGIIDLSLSSRGLAENPGYGHFASVLANVTELQMNMECNGQCYVNPA